MWRHSVSSLILKILTAVGEALWIILDELLDNTTVKEYVVVWHEDLVVDR